jgi:type I restriction enzyme S subunit
MRLKYCLSLAPSAIEAKALSGNDPVSFAPMDAIDNGLGGLSGLTDKLLSEVASGSYNFFRNGDLLLSKVTPCFENGKKAIADGLTNDVGYATSEVFVVRPISIDSRYLNYLFSSEEFRQPAIASMTGTGGLKRVDPDAVKNFELPVLEREQQELIADFLDQHCGRTESLISEKKNFISLLKEKRQALISHVVTKGLDPDVEMKDSGVEWIGEIPRNWSVGKLKYFLNAIGDVDHYMPDSVDDGIPYVMTGDLTELVSDISFESCKKVSEKDYFKLSKKIKTSKGDVVMARYATIGTLSYVDIDKKFLVSYSCVTIKPDHAHLSGLYLFYYLKSHTFLHSIQSHINTNTQGNVGVNDLKKVEICVPSSQEQERIVNFLHEKTLSIDAIIKETERSIDLLKEHRTALISAAVTGKIDLRDKEVA